MTDLQSFPDTYRQSEHPELAPDVFGQPDDVPNSRHLTREEKRAVLASWASDMRAVPHIPSLRQLPDGSIVKVDNILRALKALDERVDTESAGESLVPLWQRSFKRRRTWDLRKFSRYGRRSDDDDDPPPCPAVAATRPKSGGGAAFAIPEPVSA
ncbi:hypothetical protein ACSBOB_00800 [Mesorhizobium sp. ASY16-5R]|uniref:hypothetical protein n=1 Tax=Mesorhizobium sp. ASY16-5R TaxID=3445772 RepID=UPI003FA12941